MRRTLDSRYSYFKTEQGYEIRGLLQPADEGAVPAYQWTTPRLVLRTAPESLAKAGDIMVDAFDRRFILGDHGSFQHGNDRLYKVFRLIECTERVSWKRNQTVTDAVTRLPRTIGEVELGPIWVALEQLGRLDTDRDVRVRENPRQCITSADVQLNDVIDGQVVRRCQTLLGIKLLEIG